MKRLLLLFITTSLFAGSASFKIEQFNAWYQSGAISCSVSASALAKDELRDKSSNVCNEANLGYDVTPFIYTSVENHYVRELLSCVQETKTYLTGVEHILSEYTCNFECRYDDSSCPTGKSVNPDTCQCEATCPEGEIQDENGTCVPETPVCTEPNTSFPALANNEAIITAWNEGSECNGSIQTQTTDCETTSRCVRTTDDDNHVSPVCTGSYVSPINGVFHEDLNLDGADFHLHYQSKSTVNTIAPSWDISVHAILENETLIIGNEKRYNVEGKVVYGVDETSVSMNGLRYSFDTNNLHTQTRSAYTNTVLYSFSYNTEKKLISVTNTFNQTSQIIRDNNGIVTSIVSPFSDTTRLTITTDLDEVRYADDSFYSLSYDNHLLSEKIDPNQNPYTYVYNEEGSLVSSINPTGARIDFLQNQDASGINNTVTKGAGDETHYTRYALADGTIKTEKRLPNGELIIYETLADDSQSSVSACGITSTSTYSGTNPITNKRELVSTSVSLPSGLSQSSEISTNYDLDENNTLLSQTSTITTNAKTTSSSIDYINHTQNITSPEGRVLTQRYDTKMQNLLQTDIQGIATTTYTYDTLGRLTQSTQGDRTNTYTYDDKGNLASFTNAKNETSYYEYDERNRIIKEIYADGNEVNFSYDANSNATELITPTPASFTSAYDSVNQPSSSTSPLGYTTSYEYDAQKRLTQTTKESGKSLNYTYTNGELTNLLSSDHTYIYDYTCGSKLSQVKKDDFESINYSYDGDLLTSINYSGELNSSILFTYNNDFLADSITYSGDTQALAYDKDGLLVQSGNFHISRNIDNGLATQISDTAFTQNRIYSQYAETNKESNTVNNKDVFSYEVTARYPNGQIKTKVETLNAQVSTYDYSYDILNRLVEVKENGDITESYEYDNNGNRIKSTSIRNNTISINTSYTSEDQIERVGVYTYTYDEDGYLSSKTDGTDTTTYEYGVQGELKKVTLPDARVIEYLHNASNQRVAKKVNGIIVEKYLWKDLTTLLATYTADNQAFIKYNYADNRVPYSAEYAGNTYYLVYDQVGSLRAVTDSAGNIVKALSYDSFGNIVNDTLPSVQLPFAFAGGLYDADTGLTRFGYRDYDAATGKWTAKDPIGFAGGDTSLLNYVGGDPVNFVDPTGLIVDTLADIGFIIYDLYVIVDENLLNDCGNLDENLLALGADGAGFFIPGATGLGMATRGANSLDNLNDAVKLTKGGRTQIGNMTNLKDTVAADAIKLRGGGAGQVKKLQTGYERMSVGQLANLASQGDAHAITAMKIIKQASKKAQKYGNR